VPLTHPPGPAAAAQAGRARLLRGLPPHPLRGETPILKKLTAFVDGASRGNPGPSGYGVVLRSDSEVIEICGYLGTTTNNVAEYSGLLEALSAAHEEGADELEVVSDSLLLVQQMLGKYRVKHPNLVPLFQRAKIMVRNFRRFTIRHTLRAGNKDADRLANLAVDRADGRWMERKRVGG
jgi:ribonuclease HI